MTGSDFVNPPFGFMEVHELDCGFLGTEFVCASIKDNTVPGLMKTCLHMSWPVYVICYICCCGLGF